jgi:hypothetical protein
MEDYTCDTCDHALIDREYFLMIKHVPVTTDVILCSNEEVKDKYYNRFIKQKKTRIDAHNEIPVLIGNAHDYCRGIYYKRNNKSIFDAKEDVEL